MGIASASHPDLYRKGWEAGCASERNLLSQLRAKDARVRELESQVEIEHKTAAKFWQERDALRAELAAAKAECARMRPICDAAWELMRFSPLPSNSAQHLSLRNLVDTWKKGTGGKDGG